MEEGSTLETYLGCVNPIDFEVSCVAGNGGEHAYQDPDDNFIVTAHSNKAPTAKYV